MKKTIKLALLACLILLVSTLMLTACDIGSMLSSLIEATPSNSEQTTPDETTTPEEITTPEETTTPGEITTPEPHVHTEEPIAATEPTCTEAGLTEGKKCAGCGEILVVQETIPALGHTVVVDEAVKPTCAETGLTEGKHCSVCNEVLVKQETVKALEHSYTITLTPPTATEDGQTEYACSTCGNSYVETIIPTAFNITRSNRKKIGYTGKAGENLVIPAVFQNNGIWYKVTSIDEYAFEDCDNLKSITIPDSVTSISKGVFAKCSSIESITIPFVGASRDETTNTSFSYIFSPYSVPESLKTVVITGGTSIADSAFSKCRSLTSITIPNSVTSIGAWAFHECWSLTSITIPDSVTSIGSDAFYGCSSLTSITIPFVGASRDGTTNTHFSYIFGDSSPTDYYHYVPESLKTVVITGGTSIGINAFYACHYLTSITMPNSITSIGARAFNECWSLTSITIPDSVTSIGSAAFNGCGNISDVYITDVEAWLNITFVDTFAPPNRYGTLHILDENGNEITELIIPDSITSINYHAFTGCDSLTSITIGNSVTSIGFAAFLDCSSLTSITIGNSVTSIGRSAFKSCSRLTSITFNGTVEQWNAISKGSDWNESTGKYTVYCTDGNISK